MSPRDLVYVGHMLDMAKKAINKTQGSLAPVVHQMIKTLHAHGFIDREPGKARSIRLLLTRAELPDLD